MLTRRSAWSGIAGSIGLGLRLVIGALTPLGGVDELLGARFVHLRLEPLLPRLQHALRVSHQCFVQFQCLQIHDGHTVQDTTAA